MSSPLQPRRIQGKTIARVDLHPQPDGRGGTFTTPEIVFTDGSSIVFRTQETDTGDYGTAILYHPPPTSVRRRTRK